MASTITPDNFTDPKNITSFGKLPTFPLCLWPGAICFLIFGLAGVFGNFMILGALSVSKELKNNRCNILVGNLAVSELFHCGYFVFCGVFSLIQQINGLEHLSMTHETCFYICIPVIAAMNSGSITILAIGIDRAVSLMKPIYYKNLSSTYTYAVIAISWICGVANVVVGWQDRDPNELVPTCAPPVALRNVALAVWADGSVVINVLVLIAYAVAYAQARKLGKFRNASNDLALKNNRLLASLVTFVCVYLATAFLAMGILAVTNSFFTDPSILLHVSFHAGILVLASCSCNFYIYYARSAEHRKVFRKILGFKPDDKVSQSQVPVSNSIVVAVKPAFD